MARVIAVVLLFLSALALNVGCGTVEHAEHTARLEQRIHGLEAYAADLERYIAWITAEIEAAREEVRLAREAYMRRLQQEAGQ